MDANEIREQIPEISHIGSSSLQQKVVDAWVDALGRSEYDRLDAVPGLPMFEVDNLTHTRGVTRLAQAMAESMNEEPGVSLNVDHVIAAAICHDLGKPLEYTELDTGEWINGTWETSKPTIRHSVYSVAIALAHDFPIEVVHAIGSHSKEGEYVLLSPEANIVSAADSQWWRTYVPEVYGEPMEKLM